MYAGLLLLVPVVLLVLTGGAVLVALALTRRPDASLPAELGSARRHGVATSVLATLLLLLTPALLGLTGATLLPYGPLVGVLPLAGSAAALLVLLAGELSWPRPRGATRTALINDRRPRDLLRGGWWVGLLVTSAVLVAGVVAAAVLAGPTGRQFVVTTTGPGGATGQSAAGPFPGLPYGLPQLVALGLVLVLVGLVVRAATHRATVLTTDLDTDRLLRRASAARAYRMAIVGCLLTLAADLFFGGSAVRNAHDAGAGAGVGSALMLLAPVVGIVALVALLVPVPRLSGSAPATPLTPISA